MDKQLINDTMAGLAENFNFQYKTSYLIILMKTLENQGIDAIDFTQVITKLITNTTKPEWDKKYGFNGKPAIADWLEMVGKKGKTLTDEQQVIIEVEKMLEGVRAVQFGGGVLFDNPITNATIESYGGISKLSWDLNQDNNNKQQETWVRKELKEKWLACRTREKESITPSYRGSSTTINFIGNEDKCKQLIEQSMSRIEDKTENPILGLVKDMGDKYKINI